MISQYTWNERIDFLVKGQQKDLRIGELLHGYTLPTPGAAMNFLDSTVPVPSGPGQLMVTGQNVVQPGDSLTIYLDAVTRKTQRVVVNTAFQGDAVNLTATFATLPNGLNYPAYAELLVPAKGYAIQVQNFNFQQNGM